MARNFLSFPFAPYVGTYTSKPFNNGRGGQKGTLVAVDVLWASYQANGHNLGAANPNFCVTTNLNTAGPNTVSGTWTIQSVYIDNEGVDFPVYIYFPDSMFAISCPANAAGWYEVYTNARQTLICGIGISDSAIASAQRTRLFFTDVIMVPSLDEERPSSVPLYIGSPLIQRTNSLLPGFGPPALGDQTVSGLAEIDQITGPPRDYIILPKQSSGFFYVTSIYASAPLIQSQYSTPLGGMLINGFIGDITAQTPLMTFNLTSYQTTLRDGINSDNICILNAQNMNLRLDATHDYGVHFTGVAVVGGTLVSYEIIVALFMAYTFSPT